MNCNLYATNPLLTDVKSKQDQMLANQYCMWSQAQITGPDPTPGKRPKMQNQGMCPFRSLGNAYDFNAGPSQVNRRPVYNINN